VIDKDQRNFLVTHTYVPGIRLSPLGTFNDMGDDEPEATFGAIAKTLGDHSLAYLHIINPAIVGAIEKGIEPDPGALRMLDLVRERYRGTLIIAGGFDYDTAEGWLRQGKADLIAFGRKFLANPVPERFRSGASLNADDPSTYSVEVGCESCLVSLTW
jgi:N-ethylmaleimide reductase